MAWDQDHDLSKGVQSNSPICWNLKKSPGLSPKRSGTSPCAERSLYTSYPPRSHIFLSLLHGHALFHKSHRPAVSIASLSLWFAAKTTGKCYEAREPNTQGKWHPVCPETIQPASQRLDCQSSLCSSTVSGVPMSSKLELSVSVKGLLWSVRICRTVSE